MKKKKDLETATFTVKVEFIRAKEPPIHEPEAAIQKWLQGIHGGPFGITIEELQVSFK